MSSLDVQLLTNLQTVKSNSSVPPIFQDSTGTEIGTLCRAWVKFDGVNNILIGSFNISSVTDNGTGAYTVNFTNPMPSTNYTGAGNTQFGNTVLLFVPTSFTINGCQVQCYNISTSSNRDTHIYVAFFA